MALGVSVGAFTLLSPSMLGLSGPDALQLAGMGMLAIQVKKDQVEVAA